ncbi:hypothetical protein [Chitinimonas taiwanensis]|uniref:hypothetical protein n=1 Tax=Chitinimonas taiwanensis TaxID=240412 RepID=UPI001114C65D|nr:hypothetical protein [Chitinimonas taiwanensis]
MPAASAALLDCRQTKGRCEAAPAIKQGAVCVPQVQKRISPCLSHAHTQLRKSFFAFVWFGTVDMRGIKLFSSQGLRVAIVHLLSTIAATDRLIVMY